MKESYLNYHYANLFPESKWLFVIPSLESRDLRIVPQEIGHFKFDSIQYTERGPLESYQLGMSFCNTPGTVRFRGKEYPFCQSNEMIFLDCTKGYRIDTDGSGNSLFIHFWGADIRYYYEIFSRLNGGSPIVKRHSPVVERNLQQLLDLYGKPNDFLADLFAETLIMEMVLDLIRTVMPNARSGYGEYVQSAIQIINERYAENLTLDLLADEVHISKYYLSHIFKKETGLTPSNYLQQFRLGKAKELLRFTDLSQECICAQVGIYNCSYLCKLFRLYENSTPDQYRKSWN